MASEMMALLAELATIERSAWDETSARIPAWHPRNEGEEEEGDTEDDTKTGDTPPAEDDDVPAPDAKLEDWKAYARKWEDRAKRAGTDRKSERELNKIRKERDQIAAALKERETADQTEQERAIAAARDEGKAEAMTAVQQERRADRLESAVTRLAARGVEVGAGDKAEMVRFADPEDALAQVQHQLRMGDLDEDELFDDAGKVQTAVLTDALADVLTRKKHFRAEPNGAARPVVGDADSGKGAGSGAPDPNDMNSLIRKRGRG